MASYNNYTIYLIPFWFRRCFVSRRNEWKKVKKNEKRNKELYALNKMIKHFVIFCLLNETTSFFFIVLHFVFGTSYFSYSTGCTSAIPNWTDLFILLVIEKHLEKKEEEERTYTFVAPFEMSPITMHWVDNKLFEMIRLENGSRISFGPFKKISQTNDEQPQIIVALVYTNGAPIKSHKEILRYRRIFLFFFSLFWRLVKPKRGRKWKKHWKRTKKVRR